MSDRHSPRTAARFVSDGTAALASPRSHVDPAEPAGAQASDASLMELAAIGNVSAFARIYDRHAPSVLALANRVLRSASDAQDLVHDVFLEAWLCAREYDSARASVRTWLLVRTRSRALDRRGRGEREHFARVCISQQSESAAQRATMPQTERQLAIQQALATLDPHIREVLELTYFEGMTAPEVAQRMSTPEGTVKSRLARGLECLLRVLSLLEERRP